MYILLFFNLGLQLTIPILINLNQIIFSVNQFVYKMAENGKKKKYISWFSEIKMTFFNHLILSNQTV